MQYILLPLMLKFNVYRTFRDTYWADSMAFQSWQKHTAKRYNTESIYVIVQ